MSIIVTTDFAGQIGVNPRLVRVLTTDTLTAIVAPGWLNTTNLLGQSILPTDVLFVSYEGNNFGLFSAAIAGNGQITLTQEEAPLSGPAVTDHIVAFADNAGTLKDSGYMASDATKAVVASVNLP